MRSAVHLGRAIASALIAVASTGLPSFGQEHGLPPPGSRGGTAVSTPRSPAGPTVKLPAPRVKGDTSVEQALLGRRTRPVAAGKITLEEVGQLLWAAQGITGQWARRAVPSVGGAYPLEVLLVAGDVTGLMAGVYRYYPASSVIERLTQGDPRPDVARVCKFTGIERAPAIVVITGVESRVAKVGPTGAAAHQYVAIEAGGASQNLMLEAVALGLGTAMVDDSNEGALARILHVGSDEKPFVVVAISRE